MVLPAPGLTGNLLQRSTRRSTQPPTQPPGRLSTRPYLLPSTQLPRYLLPSTQLLRYLPPSTQLRILLSPRPCPRQSTALPIQPYTQPSKSQLQYPRQSTALPIQPFTQPYPLPSTQ